MAENTNADSWETLDPTKISVNKEYCRKSSRITFYSNDTYSVAMNYCHRWDCAYCARARTERITDLAVRTCVGWHWVPGLVTERNYGAMKKRVERAGSEWLAVGTSERGWIFFTEKPVVDGSSSVTEEKINMLVPFALRGPYTFKERRLRHSEGLFPSYSPSAEVEGYVVVKENAQVVRSKLTREGYIDSSKRKKVSSADSAKPDDGTGWIEADMLDDMTKGKWFTVLKKEGV